MSILKLNPFIYVLCVGTVISRIGTSMSVPFLAVIMHVHFGISYSIIGIVIGLSTLSIVFGGFLGGFFSKKIGGIKLTAYALVGYALSFSIFPLVEFTRNKILVALFLLCLNTFAGFCRAVVESLGQALIVTYASSEEERNSGLNLRYTAANMGSAIGPLLGGLLGLSQSLNCFYIASLSVSLYFLFFYFMSRHLPNKEITNRNEGFLTSIQPVFRDKTLQWILLGGIVVFFVFIQHEAVLSQIMTKEFGSSSYFAILMSINCVLITFLQYPVNQLLLKRYSAPTLLIVGCLGFVTGHFVYSISGHKFYLYAFGDFFFTMGEILIMPISSIFIGIIAPQEQRNIYFGSMTLQYIGFVLGPMVGGFSLQLLGGATTMMSVGLISFIPMVFYLNAFRFYKKNTASVIINPISSEDSVNPVDKETSINFGKSR